MSVFWWSDHGFCAASDSAVVARSGTQSPPPQFQRSYGHGRGRDLSPPRRGGFPPAWPRSGSDPERAPASDSGSRAEGAPSMAMKGSMHLYSSPPRELILNEPLIWFASRASRRRRAVKERRRLSAEVIRDLGARYTEVDTLRGFSVGPTTTCAKET